MTFIEWLQIYPSNVWLERAGFNSHFFQLRFIKIQPGLGEDFETSIEEFSVTGLISLYTIIKKILPERIQYLQPLHDHFKCKVLDANGNCIFAYIVKNNGAFTTGTFYDYTLDNMVNMIELQNLFYLSSHL